MLPPVCPAAAAAGSGFRRKQCRCFPARRALRKQRPAAARPSSTVLCTHGPPGIPRRRARSDPFAVKRPTTHRAPNSICPTSHVFAPMAGAASPEKALEGTSPSHRAPLSTPARCGLRRCAGPLRPPAPLRASAAPRPDDRSGCPRLAAQRRRQDAGGRGTRLCVRPRVQAAAPRAGAHAYSRLGRRCGQRNNPSRRDLGRRSVRAEAVAVPAGGAPSKTRRGTARRGACATLQRGPARRPLAVAPGGLLC